MSATDEAAEGCFQTFELLVYSLQTGRGSSRGPVVPPMSSRTRAPRVSDINE